MIFSNDNEMTFYLIILFQSNLQKISSSPSYSCHLMNSKLESHYVRYEFITINSTVIKFE